VADPRSPFGEYPQLGLGWRHLFAFNPSSTRRRMASERLASFFKAQSST
jgi:hypothetical protein